MSKFEDKVAALLKDGKIKFKREVSFPDLNSLKGKKLRFDFVLYDGCGRIIACIETDGAQHFYQVPYFQKTIFDFRRTQEWDRIKNSYCLRKRIPLIRIPYWDQDNLTLTRILTYDLYRVKSKFHTDLLIQKIKMGEVKEISYEEFLGKKR